MKVICYATGCTNSMEVEYPVSPSFKYSCREHTEKSENKIRFQAYQFDDRLIGTGTDPKSYEQRPQPRKGVKRFPKTGRSRTKAFERIEQSLAGVVNAAEIMKVLRKDHESLGPLAGEDSE